MQNKVIINSQLYSPISIVIHVMSGHAIDYGTFNKYSFRLVKVPSYISFLLFSPNK